MPTLSAQEIEAVLKLAGPERYQHFVKRVADWEEAWGLYEGGWALAGDDDGNETFPLWPNAEYAKLCAIDDWNAYVPKAISLDELLDELLPSLADDGVRPAVFMTPTGRGVVVSATELAGHLEAELGNYE